MVRWLLTQAGVVLVAAHAATAQTPSPPAPVTASQFETMMTALSNWGRWGANDELGTLNLITPEVRRAAAAEVRDGLALSLARRIDTTTESSDPQRARLRMLAMGRTENVTAHTDELTLAPHGPTFTHFDAPAHFFWKGRMYNGVSRDVVGETGTPALGVDVAAGGVFTRGVLVDVARCAGVPQLPPATPITDGDLEACLTRQRVSLRAGDAVLIRTGRANGPPGQRAGLHASAVRLLKRHDIAVAGSDSSIDAWPSGVEGVRSPIHVLLLVAMGTPVLDHLELDDLASRAAERQRWTFLLTVAPLRAAGATGAAVNPTALF